MVYGTRFFGRETRGEDNIYIFCFFCISYSTISQATSHTPSPAITTLNKPQKYFGRLHDQSKSIFSILLPNSLTRTEIFLSYLLIVSAHYSVIFCCHERPPNIRTYLLILPYFLYRNCNFYTSSLQSCWRYYRQLWHYWQIKGYGSAWVGGRHRLHVHSYRRTHSKTNYL